MGGKAKRAKSVRGKRKSSAHKTAIDRKRPQGQGGNAIEALRAEQRFRRELGRRLHDDMQQILSAARLKVGIVRRTLQIGKADLATATSDLVKAEQMLESAIDESRRLATELRIAPHDDA